MSPRRKDRSEKPPVSDESDPPFDEPIIVPIEDSIDLHAFSPKEIPSVVEEYIEQCVQAGIYEVRIIHGRGTGMQRRIVQSILKKNPRVASFKDAPAEAGGWGATVVALKK
jgi:dsDNA-specific endonuclease/ATPase MutS2